MFAAKDVISSSTFNQNCLDWIVLLFLLLIIYILNSSDPLSIQKVFVVGIVFFAIRLLGVLLPAQYVGILFFACIVGACLIETVWGIYQLCHPNKSSTIFICTGSFDNPGPYGGFLATCICIILGIRMQIIISVVRRLLTLTAILAFIMMITTNSRASFLSLSVGLLVLATQYDKYRSLLKKHCYLLLFSLVVISVFTYYIKKPSADARLFMYRINLGIMLRSGLMGLGFGNFGGEYGLAQFRFFKERIPDIFNCINISDSFPQVKYIDCPVFAFNDFIQLGIEGGWILLLLLLLILYLSIKRTYINRNPCCLGIISICIFALFSYPFEKTEFQILLSFLIAIGQIQSKRIMSYRNMVSYSLIFLFFGYSFFNLLPDVRKNVVSKKIWRSVSFDYESGEYGRVINYGDRYKKYLINDFGFLFEFGTSLSKAGYFAESDSLLEMGSNKSSDPMFWNVMGNNCLAQGKYREAEERYKHAFYMLPNRLFPLYNLAKLYHTEGDTTKFLEMAEILETFVPKIESTKTESLREEIRELKNDYILECVQ